MPTKITLPIYSINYLLLFFSLFSGVCFAASDEHHSHESLLEHNENEQFIAVVPESFPPFYYVDDEQKPYGMAIEVLNEIDHNADFLTKFIIKKNWQEVFKTIDSGQAHIIPSLGITEKRAQKYFFTKPYTETKINAFTRADSSISKISHLKNRPVGVIKNNAGVKAAKRKNLINTQVFNSIDTAFDALINKKIDAVIYPRLIGLRSANNLNVDHLIRDSHITFEKISRAIAVSKKYPELYKRINIALDNYLKTQDYKDTYFAWLGKEKNTFSMTELILFNIMVLFFSVGLLNYYWRKNYTILKDNNKGKTKLVWVSTLISILITATSIVTFTTLWVLYETSFNEQRARLIDSVKSRARLIEAIARYDMSESKHLIRSVAASKKRTLSQIIDAHKNFSGFGETGEFTLAQKTNNQIEFILRQRHSKLSVPEPVSFNSKLAAPMRLALFGHSGTIVGPDYRGETVLAAYEPVRVLDLGIVAKIDITEIRKPFIRSALYILSIAIIVSLLGSLLFFYIVLPVIGRIKETEQRFHQLFLNNHTPALLVDASDANIFDANKAAIEYYGYSIEELQSFKFNVLCYNTGSTILNQLQSILNHKNKSFISQHQLKNGEIKDVEILMSLVQLDKQTIIHCTIIDITNKLTKEKEHAQLERDLEQARKMEALGQLTGGIAHDFNNMLGIIMGYTELSREKLSSSSDSGINEYLKNIMTASNRAKELISSMMLFSRTGEGKYKTANISPLIKEDFKMLRSIIPSSIEMESYIDETLPKVLIEPVKLQQLLMNLCVNARDAMDAKGTLKVELGWNKNVYRNCLICHESLKGDWIDLSISDTGTGIESAVLNRIFEPFFTTKSQGKGTGMGMAVVHGIVQDFNGHVIIDSEINKGTTVHVLLSPVYDDPKKTTISNERSPVKRKEHNEKILIVDDEKYIADLLEDTLLLEGYQCTSFTSSAAALNEFSKNPNDYDLIISDQTMPELTGLEMVKRMRKVRSDIPAIIATGYSDSIDEEIANENEIILLNKPVARELLLDSLENYFD